MRLDDGHEVLCTLALPLPVRLVGELGMAISEAAQRAGYSEATLLCDGTNRIIAAYLGDEVDGEGGA